MDKNNKKISKEQENWRNMFELQKSIKKNKIDKWIALCKKGIDENITAMKIEKASYKEELMVYVTPRQETLLLHYTTLYYTAIHYITLH